MGRMLKLAIDGVLSFSVAPLRIATWCGLISAAAAVTIIVYALVLRVLTETWVSGWTLMMIAIAFFSGVQLIFLGVIGEYIGRIFDETKQRPLFVVGKLHGFDLPAPRPRSSLMRQ